MLVTLIRLKGELMSKMKSRNDEPAIQQKEYSQEEYNKKKRKSFKVAKLSCYSAELMVVIGWNLMLSLILFLVLLLGTSALPYIMDVKIDFTPESMFGLSCFIYYYRVYICY